MATKDTLIEMSDTLIRQKGVNAFSYHHLSQPLGIKNAAVHYHFPTKTHLLVSVTQYHIQRFEDFKTEVEALCELEKVERFVNIYVNARTQNSVCFVGAMATDWATVDETVQPYMQQMANKILEWLTQTLQAGLQKGTLYFNEPARTRALLIVTNMMAATQLARIVGSESFETVKQTVLSALKPKQ